MNHIEDMFSRGAIDRTLLAKWRLCFADKCLTHDDYKLLPDHCIKLWKDIDNILCNMRTTMKDV